MESLPTIEGWLDKQGGVRKSWKRRYFVLDGKKLKYFKQQRDAPHKPIDAITLERTSKIIYIRDKVRPNDPAPGCGFAIETPSRTYILAAVSVVERDKWAIDIQIALSILYNLPRPVTLARAEKPAGPAAGPAGDQLSRQPSATFSGMPSTSSSTSSAASAGSNGYPSKPSSRYSMALSEVPNHQPAKDIGQAGVDGSPMIEEYGSDSDRRGERGGSSQNLLHMAKNGLNALNPTGRVIPLGRKDEVEMLKEELVRKDRQLELTERKVKLLDGAYADMSEKYFVSVAVFAKMNATTEGYYCNIDVYQLYAEAQRLKIEPQEWPQWITAEVQKNAYRMRS